MPKDEDKREERADRADLPETIRRSDEHAQRIFLATLESARETYGDGGRARRVAYASLKHQYEKKGNRWVRKPEAGPSDPQAARGPTTARKSTDPDRAPTAGGKVARDEKEAREKAKEARREYDRSRRG
jgi:cation transport regulator ChaB